MNEEQREQLRLIVDEISAALTEDYASGRYRLNNYNYAKDALDALAMLRSEIAGSDERSASALVDNVMDRYAKLHADAEGFGVGVLVDVKNRMS